MKTWLKNCGRALYKHHMMILLVAAFISVSCAAFAFIKDAAFWESIVITPEPELCALCEDGDGIRYQAPVLLNLTTGRAWELKIYDRDPTRPWEVAEDQRWDDWVFTFLDENAAMSWSSVDHTNIASITDNSGMIDPAHYCHDCRALLTETAMEGYILLDLYDLGDIRAFAVKNGEEYTIRDYTVSIYKDKENGGLTIETVGHLFQEK